MASSSARGRALSYFGGAAALAIAWGAAGGALAQDAATLARIEALEAQIAALQEQIGDLKVSTSANIRTIRAEQKATAVSIKGGRPTFSSSDGQFSASIRGVMQLDAAYYDQSNNLPASVTAGRDLNSGTNFRRGRLGVEGKLFGDFDYNALLDFGGSGTDGATTLHELWLQYSGFKGVKIKGGAFAPNLGLEDAASTNGSLFPERPSAAEVSRLLAGADKRIALQVQTGGERWLAAAAVTGAKVTDAATFDEQLGYTFRVAGSPLVGYDWRVHVGANASIVAKPAQTASGYPITLEDRPELRVDGSRLVSASFANADGANHWGLELAAQKKNLLVQGEYFDIGVDRPSSSGLPDPGFTGWYVEGGWVLTGEARKYNTANGAFDAPAVDKPFDLEKGQWGAWELAARYSVLDLNYREGAAGTVAAASAIRGGEQEIWSAGVNWFVNPAIRFSLNYLDVSVDRLNSAGLQSGQGYQAVNLRSQLAF